MPRLFDYLGVHDAQRSPLIAPFRKHSEAFWRAVNDYLVHHEGSRGLPTAFALGHRYVGLPQSQALLRGTDRARLPGFFRAFALPPGADLVPADIEGLLDAWVQRVPPPVSANFVRLWKGKARERISGVVALELSTWDGRFRSEDVAEPERSGDLSVTALLRRKLGGERLELSFAARFGHDESVDLLRVTSADAAPTLAVIPLVGGRVRPAPGSFLDAESLVGGKVELQDPRSGEIVLRLPRRVVPMHKDELVGLYVETERVQLAEDALVLVKDEASLVESVRDLVSNNGRYDKLFAVVGGPGRSALAGVPKGWVLFSGVQIYTQPPSTGKVDLHALIPLASARLVFSGGLKLPGRVRKWSSHEPPEVRAVVADPGASVSLVLTPLGDTRADSHNVLAWSGQAGALVVAIGPLSLGDGDYELGLEVDGAAVAQSVLRLRSGSSPDLASWESCTRLVYDLGDGLGLISATELTDELTRYVDGPRTAGAATTPSSTASAPPQPFWITRPRTDRVLSRPVVLGDADPDSCLVTGRHYMQLPPYDGRKARGHIDGVCRDCNLVKRYPATPKKARQVSAAPHVTIDLSQLPPYETHDIDNDILLDALVHVGGGTMSSFERVATQADASSLFVDELLRTLEVLGHIDVRRDERCQPVEWEASPAQLAELSDGSYLLTGIWGAISRQGLAVEVEAAGGAGGRLPGHERVSSWIVSGLEAEVVDELAAQYDVNVVHDAAWALLCALPGLGALEQNLKKVDIPSFTKAERFDVRACAWVSTLGVTGPGAYRLRQSFRSVCLWVDEDGAQQRTGRIGTPQLVKHLAAKASGKPLLAHLRESHVLAVPLGADLPGLLGRAAALCSGRPPMPSTKTRTLAYHSVPRRAADAIAGLLTR